jgi:hypothetical protein
MCDRFAFKGMLILIAQTDFSPRENVIVAGFVALWSEGEILTAMFRRDCRIFHVINNQWVRSARGSRRTDITGS